VGSSCKGVSFVYLTFDVLVKFGVGSSYEEGRSSDLMCLGLDFRNGVGSSYQGASVVWSDTSWIRLKEESRAG